MDSIYYPSTKFKFGSKYTNKLFVNRHRIEKHLQNRKKNAFVVVVVEKRTPWKTNIIGKEPSRNTDSYVVGLLLDSDDHLFEYMCMITSNGIQSVVKCL